MSDFDFDKMMALAKNPLAFEAERARVINSYIKTLPEERRQAAFKFQKDLDLKRIGMKSVDFIGYCAAKMTDNLDQIQTLSQAAAATLAQMLVQADELPIPDNVVLLKGIEKPKP